MSMEVSIIIINWNSKAYLRSCLNSLQEHTRDIQFEVLVVDNASFDGCGGCWRAEFPGVCFIQSDENLGFSRGNNLAARSARGNTLLFLNPDTELSRPAIEKLYRALMSLPNAGAVGPRLLNSDGTLQTSCIQSFPTVVNQLVDSEALRGLFPRSRLWGMSALFKAGDEPAAVEGISGACLMVKRDVFERVGGFDDRYFMYAEDIDLSFKIHQAGRGLYYIPDAQVVHHGGGSSQSARSAFSVVMMRESVYRFLRFRRGRVSAGCFTSLSDGVFAGPAAHGRAAGGWQRPLARAGKPGH